MPPDTLAVVHATEAWLQTSWYVQVPFAWLEACLLWLQEEAGGAGRLSQQQINQQVLDQWLLTDLRDLDYPVLPEGLGEAQKTELNGIFCVQVDSFLDISQPMYGQLQKWRGTDCNNDDVSAVSLTTQRPWEAKPTRMLVLQVTDGVQSLEAMEYQTIPAFNTALKPGVKLQLQGRIFCRLGMLLLGPSNIKVLGGEVEDLAERNNQGRMLCRALGLPEEEQQQEEEEVPLANQQGNQEVEDLELDDAEMLASLQGQEEVEMVQDGSPQDSGYRTVSETCIQLSRASSARSIVSGVSFRSEPPTHSYRSSLTQSRNGGSVQDLHHGNKHEASDKIQRGVQSHIMVEEDFPDDDLPLDELDGMLFQKITNVTVQPDTMQQNNSSIAGNPHSLAKSTKLQTAQFGLHTSKELESRLGSSNSRSVIRKRDYQGFNKGATEELVAAASFSPTALDSHELDFLTNDQTDFMDEDLDCFPAEVETNEVQPGKAGSSYTLTSKSSQSVKDIFPTKTAFLCGSSLTTAQTKTSSITDSDPQTYTTVPALTLTSPPFTYLCLLEDFMSNTQAHTTEILVKAFIVTLLGKLTSSKGVWSVCVTISDGTGYLDVELSDMVLTDLLGFSVAQKAALKRDPALRGELDAGMRRCQEELVDMCCVMTIVVKPEGRKALVTKAAQVSEKTLRELEQRVRDRRKISA
ncbi:recQ-mediated genome instability protein 1 [Echeneis naucrates]|uniref:recQ-mediated genome instability protein 1 n=1 Tax=Echeneis naucrates TaxID=173247 RepID=UPI0011143B1A|nr:recQ-mediated genome instability protein 1 [Echeneis naucrates]